MTAATPPNSTLVIFSPAALFPGGEVGVVEGDEAVAVAVAAPASPPTPTTAVETPGPPGEAESVTSAMDVDGFFVEVGLEELDFVVFLEEVVPPVWWALAVALW